MSLDFIPDHIVLILYISFISKQRSLLRQKTNEINELILRQEYVDQEKKTYLMSTIGKQLKSISKLNVTVWSVFRMDMSLLLSYISCVLTFTVMFVGFAGVK